LCSCADLTAWWQEVEPVLKRITGADRNMGRFVVYKNFPREVLEMTETELILKQVLIYLGVSQDVLTEEEQERPPLGDMTKLKVLSCDAPGNLLSKLMAAPYRWSDNQMEWARSLTKEVDGINLSEFAFKENGVRLAIAHFDEHGLGKVTASSATDVLRLAAGMSGCDISLREKVWFRKFKRAERRYFLSILDTMPNLVEDMGARPEMWKRFMQRLHPGDYGWKNVSEADDRLYKGQAKSFSANIERTTSDVLETAATRPGEYLRRFHRFYSPFGEEAVRRFLPIMPQLTTRQLVSLRAYLRTINGRANLMYPPRSKWSKVQVAPNEKVKIADEHRAVIDARISEILCERLARAFPEGLRVDPRVKNIKFQTNDQKLAEYGRGTTFNIPEGITFIRSASYWMHGGMRTTWFDNSWNFFGEQWRPLGSCGWYEQRFHDAAIFSGDPVNRFELEGRARQMEDLYIDRLVERGVRYAVWNILCYGGVKFSDAEEVLATLQFGEEPESGRLYEPARAQMVFQLKSPTLSSYVAYLDLVERKLVYMDVAFPADVRRAEYNSVKLTTLMPAYLEYLDALPGINDLVKDAPDGKMPVLYSDAETEITEGRAFVFRPENPKNSFDLLDRPHRCRVTSDKRPPAKDRLNEKPRVQRGFFLFLPPVKAPEKAEPPN